MIREILESLKDIILDYVKHRLFPVTVLVFVLFFILIRRLFTLQIVEGDEHLDNFIYKSQRVLNIESVRGNITDRNGKLLAYNELSYSVVYSNDANIKNKADELGISENELRNQIVNRTIEILEENGDSLRYDFPIELLPNGTYQFSVSNTQLKNFIKNVYGKNDFDSLSDEQKNSSALDIINYLDENKFEVSDTYTQEEKLKIIACRYKLWLNRYQQYMPVTIAYDISEESNAAITEYKDELLGMSVDVKSLRKYNDAKYFAHIIGYIGAISDEELKQYNKDLPKEEKYYGGEMVGKIGIEQYCESYLRGTNGQETMYVDSLGKIIETTSSTPALAGNDVKLTIDLDLQKYCYDTLEKEIASILLANICEQLDVNEGENTKIPISDVYFGLFNNNYLSVDKMNDENASELEHNLYKMFIDKKQNTINRIDDILKVNNTILGEMSEEYQAYMEYICEILVENNIFNNSLISYEDPEFILYTTNQSSLRHYLEYAISLEAIDISSFEAKSDYYDTEELYMLLCDYIINYLNEDPEFDKLLVKVMIQSGEISGKSVVDLLYLQGVLNSDGDTEYAEFKNGTYGPYEFMLRKIQKLDITPAMLALDPCSGAIIVTDVNNGDVLAMVSYPGYDNNKLTNEVDPEYYNRLLNDKTKPLYNRATQQKTAPGSTYKILSSVAGMTEGIIDASTYYGCNGEFEKITPSPKCWAYPNSHGAIDVEKAIEVSCNVFYYQLGYNMSFLEDGTYSDSYGLSRLAKYANQFGLDQLSGVEIAETQPTVSDNDAVRSAIGQGKNAYAPVQLSRYVTTVANSGTCYNLTLIDSVNDYKGNLVLDNKADIINKVDLPQTTWNSVHNGMRRVISNNTPGTELIKKVNVSVAGKSGTAQESETRPNHALFISYAPFDDPEVSVTCVIQCGYSSGNVRELAGYIYAYMYDPEKLAGASMSGNSVLSD